MAIEKLLPLVLFAAIAGCAPLGEIETSADPATLPAFKTFRVYQEQYAFATDITAEQRERVSREVRTSVVSALEERGYHEAADADVLVALGAMSRPTLSTESESGSGPLHHVDTSVLDPGRPPTMPASEIPPAGLGREGDLTLELLDPKTQRVLWHATSTGAATTPSEALRKARATYAAMVARLPRAAQD